MEFKKYSWDDFFAFDDETPLNQFGAALNGIEKKYTDMRDTIVRSNERIIESQGTLIDRAKAVLKSIDATQTAQEDSADVMNKAAKSTAELSGEMKVLRDMEAANKKEIAELEKQIAALTAAKEKAKKATDGEAGSLKQLETRLKEAVAQYKSMGDATDQAVKDEQLKRVRELAAQHKDASNALNTARKSAVSASGSYNELSKRVADAKKRLKEMEGGIDGNTVEFKALQKEVSEGSAKLKEFDASIGDNQRNVGNYKSALETVIPGFGTLTAEIEGATTAGKAFIASPLGLVLAAVAAALGLVAAYFARTDEGGDKLAEILTVISEVFGVLLDVAARAGKVIFDAISEPAELWESFVDLLIDGKNVLIDVFTSPKKYIKELGEFLERQLINRIKAFSVIGEAINDIFTGEFQTGFKKLADGAIQFGTGVENATDKITAGLSEMFGGLADSIAEAARLAREIAALEDDADSKRIENIKLAARIELQSVKLIQIAKNKLSATDEARFSALRQEGKLQDTLLQNQLVVAEKLLAVAQKRIQIRQLEGDVTDDLKEAEANALKEVLALRARDIQERTARQKIELQLVREVETEMLTQIKRERDARFQLSKFLLEDRVRLNNEIVKDEEKSLDEILSAIMDSSDAQNELLIKNREQQLEVARESAMERVQLSDDELSTIYNNESLSLRERIEQERAIRASRLDEDQAFVDERTRIEQEYFAKLDALNKATAESAENNIFKILARDAERLRDSTDTLIAEGLIDLNREFENGEIRAAEYQRRREEIQTNGQRAQLESQLDYLEQQMKLFQQYGHDTTDLERQIAEARLALSDQTASELLAREQQLQQALNDLRTTATDTAFGILQSSFEKEQMALDERLTRLQDRLAIELQMAGDNEAAKAELQNKFALEQQKIELQKAQIARRAATFEKVQAIFTIGVNTAIAISKAIAAAPLTGGLPFSAIAAALGALQIAAVLAKPIPAYEEGTLFHPGGLALFGEAGGEIVERPGGRMSYHDAPTVENLPRGSRVYNAEQTQRMLESNSMMAQSLGQYAADNERLGTPQDVAGFDREMMDMMSQRFESLEQTVKHKREFHINITRSGLKKLVREYDSWTEYLNQTYL